MNFRSIVSQASKPSIKTVLNTICLILIFFVSTNTLRAIASPDLIVQSIAADKTTLDPGESFEIQARLWNQGTAVSGATTLRYYLSTDDTISLSDTEVGSDRVDALSGRGASAVRRRADLSQTLTAPDTPGVHYYGVCIDAVTDEADTSNNCSQAIAITVEAPPPEPVVVEVPGDSGNLNVVDIQGPDLIISTVRVDASTVKQGAGVRFHITLTNQGTHAAPATTIRYYISTDATISADDTEMRAVPVGGLGAGRSYTTWALLPSPFAVGVYYYGACLDTVTSEFDTTNNCSDAIEITTEAQGTGNRLIASGTISTQALEVNGSPIVLNVSDKFVGNVESYTASSSNTSSVTVSLSGTEVTLTPVSEGWSVVTIQASTGNRVATQAFSVSVGNPDTPPPSLSGGFLNQLIASGRISTQALEVDGSPIVLDVSGKFVGNVESYTASSSETSVVTVSLSGSEVTLTPVSEGWSVVRIRTTSGNSVAWQVFSVSVGNPTTPPPTVPGPSGPTVPGPLVPDLSPVALIPDEILRELVRAKLGLSEGDTLTQQKMAALTILHSSTPGIVDITGLEHATNLTHLYLQDGPIVDLSPIAGLTSLTLLWFYNNQISDISLIAGLTNLTKLSLQHNQISDISHLAGLTNLTFLHIGGNQVVDISHLAGLTNLTKLSVGYNPIVDISPIAGLTNLTDLGIVSNPIVDISPIAGLTNLTDLFLYDSQISDLTPVQNLTNLTFLQLSENQISDLTPVQNLTSLSLLYLRSNQISDLTPVQNLTSLTYLGLSNNQISDVTPLENLTALRKLEVSGNTIEDLAPLRRLKENNPSVDIDIDINTDVQAAPSAPLIPAETALLSNYPNPFNPETWIPYQLAEPANVALTIYDVRGIMVRRLTLGHQPAGFYRSRGRAVHWDGRNEIGEKVATGLYFYTLTAGEFNATGKMLIQK